MKHHESIYNSLNEKNPHIKKLQRKALFRFLSKLAIMEIIMIAMIVLPKKNTIYIILFGIALAVILPFVFLKPKEVIGTKRSGKIKKITYVTHKAPRQDRVFVDFVKSDFVTFIECTVIDENGEKWTFKLEERYNKIYHEGDDVVSLRLLKYPINLTQHDFIVCPFCGNIMPKPVTHCVECGALPIDTESK